MVELILQKKKKNQLYYKMGLLLRALEFVFA